MGTRKLLNRALAPAFFLCLLQMQVYAVTFEEASENFEKGAYEDAKIQEARNTPTIQVLDLAVSPIERSSPKRALMVLVMAVAAFICTSMYALFLENRHRIHSMP